VVATALNGVDIPGSIIWNIVDGTVTFDGIEEPNGADKWSYQITTDSTFSTVQVNTVSGELDFKLGVFTVISQGEGEAIDLQYDLTGTDEDGDAASGTLNVSILPNGVSGDNFIGDAGDNTLDGNPNDNIIAGLEGNDTLNGLLGNDELFGGDGNDRLDGGDGLDTLTGGDDADTFVLTSLDAIDIFADYNFGEGDDIDLTALFTTDLNSSDGNPDNNTLADFVRIVDGGGDASLEFDADGGGDSFTQIAVLQGVVTLDTVKITFNDDDGGTSSGNIVV
jgi:Ca2+-binding RTX toxin-like protein